MEYKKSNCVKEAVIQAELYRACVEASLGCDLEYVVSQDGYQTCRFDLVVVEGSEIIAIVEVKSIKFLNSSVENSEQILNYNVFNVPVFLLYSIYDIPYLVKELLEIRSKFLESIDPTLVKCFEANRQSKSKWDNKITEAFDYFDEVFPDYKFGNHSLELLAEGVKILGLPDLLKQITLYANVDDFFFGLSNLVIYMKSSPLRFLNTRKRNIKTCLQYQNRQDRIDEKLR